MRLKKEVIKMANTVLDIVMSIELGADDMEADVISAIDTMADTLNANIGWRFRTTIEKLEYP
jgi:hypothetical protein